MTLKVPGLTIKQNQALASEFAIEAARTLQEQQRHDRLTALGLPLVQIAFDPWRHRRGRDLGDRRAAD